MPAAFRRSERIRRRPEFLLVYERGVKAHGRYLTVFLLARERPPGRLGIAATRKLGGAVERNRAKRLIREVFRRNKIATGFDVVVVPKREVLDASLTVLEADTFALSHKPFVARVVLLLIRGYQILISQYFTGSCRFLPSCSEYARGAVETHGVVRGGGLALRRLARCHPFCAGGHDPVPQ